MSTGRLLPPWASSPLPPKRPLKNSCPDPSTKIFPDAAALAKTWPFGDFRTDEPMAPNSLSDSRCPKTSCLILGEKRIFRIFGAEKICPTGRKVLFFFFFEGGGWSVFEIPYEMMFPLPTTKVIYFIRIEPKWPIFWKLQPIKWFRPPSCQKGVICVPGISLPNSKLSAKRNERCWSLLVWFPSISRRFWPENQTTYPFFKGNASKNLVGKYSS